LRKQAKITAPAVLTVAAMLMAVPRAALAQSAGQWQNPDHLYGKVCAHCHDTGVAPTIVGRDFKPDHYVTTVRHGSKAMPAFRITEIDDAALLALAEQLAAVPHMDIIEVKQ
jgi:mono/diheme cytochrome c family protein